MLKSLLRIAVLSAALIPFRTYSAFGLPQTLSSYYPIVPSKNSEKPICYIQIDGITLDLGTMCRLNDERNRQLQQSQSTGQLCNNSIACRDAYDPTQPPPQAIYIPSSPPN